MVSVTTRNPNEIREVLKRKGYTDWLRHPKWQRKRLEVMQRDGFRCVRCGDEESELHVHHMSYIPGRKPWEYPLQNFETICRDCHDLLHQDVQTLRAVLFEQVTALGLPGNTRKLAGWMIARASRDFVDAVVRFAEMFWAVFHSDWEMTKLSLRVSDGTSFISDGGTFLEPGVDDKANNWASRGQLLIAFRQLLIVMEELGLPSESPFFHDDDDVDPLGGQSHGCTSVIGSSKKLVKSLTPMHQ